MTQLHTSVSSNKVVYVQHNKNADGYIPFDSPYHLSFYMQKLILDSKMTYKDIAEKANLSQRTVSNLASHHTRDPRVNTCIKILQVFNKKFYVK